MLRTHPICRESAAPTDGLRAIFRRLEHEIERTPRPTPRRPPAVVGA